MRIAIVGAGAIGSLFGYRLYKSGQEVTLVHRRKKVVETLNKKGLTIEELSGRVSNASIQAKQFLSNQDDLDLILLTVKAYDTLSAAKLLHKWRPKNEAVILSLQNGLGNIEALSHHLPTHLILAGTTTEGAFQIRPGKIAHTGEGHTWIGEPNGKISDRCRALSSTFLKAGFRADVSKNISGVIWAKAIVNSAINPVSALTGARNGDLLAIPSLRTVSVHVVEEGNAVSHAAGVQAEPDPANLLLRILKMASINKSSMLQDVEAGRRTEIEQLNGIIADAGRRLQVPTPWNDLLLRLVRGLEAIRSRLETSDRSQSDPLAMRLRGRQGKAPTVNFSLYSAKEVGTGKALDE